MRSLFLRRRERRYELHGADNGHLDQFLQHDRGGASSNGYGQVGFERDAGSTLRWFSAFNPTGASNAEVTRFSAFGVTDQIGVRHIFRVLYVTTCHCLHAYIDLTDWDSSLWSPYSYFGSFPSTGTAGFWGRHQLADTQTETWTH
jgi:hypothetical protein